MDNNNEAGFDVINAINDDDNGGDLFERIYLGQTLVNIPNVPFRLIIDASVTKIDGRACNNSRMLHEVIFHNKVITIGRHAFRGCSNLQRLELPEGLLRLEHAAFFGCTSLQQITIPASVQYMGDAVYGDCMSVHRVVFAPRTTSIELGSGIFWDCTILQFVTLPPNLRSIPASFFEGCISLTNLQIPESVEEIGVEALYGSGIQSIEIPKHVHQIRSRAFKNCAFLERVTIYSTNLNLGPRGTNIFVNCPRLSTIMIAPWLWPKLFFSMDEHPQFIFQFFRHYHTKILDFETPDVRLFRRVRRDRKRTAAMIDDG